MHEPLAATAASGHTGRVYRYYDLVMVAFVTVLLCSNLIGAAKAAQVTLPVIEIGRAHV